MPTKDIYIGTMSGTSADAVESCALNIDNKSVSIIGSYSIKISSKDQMKILDLAAGKSATAQDFGEINQLCTRYFLKSIHLFSALQNPEIYNFYLLFDNYTE